MDFFIPLYCKMKNTGRFVNIDFIESKGRQRTTYIRSFSNCEDRLNGTCTADECPGYNAIPYNCDEEFFNQFA